MTLQEKREESLIRTLEDYASSINDVYDKVYELIDKKCRKTDVSYVMSRHKQKLKKLETKLKQF